MRREERQQAAGVLCKRMASRLGDGLIVGGVYGSTASGTDTEWSDLELFFVVRNEKDEAANHFIFRDIVVGYRSVTKHNLESLLTTPSRRWAFHMGVLSKLRVLCGDAGQVRSWLRLGQSVPRERFRAALEELLPDLVTEAYGRILSCRVRRDTHDVWPCVFEVVTEMELALCLLNGLWVTHGYYQGLLDTFAFPKLPEGYRELVPALWESRDIEETIRLSGQLVRNFRGLLEQEGIRAIKHEGLEDVPI